MDHIGGGNKSEDITPTLLVRKLGFFLDEFGKRFPVVRGCGINVAQTRCANVST